MSESNSRISLAKNIHNPKPTLKYGRSLLKTQLRTQVEMPVYRRRKDKKAITAKVTRYGKKPYTPGRVTKLNPGRGIYGFPSELVTRLRYNDTIELTLGVSGVVGHTFRMNSLFDPDLTGTGHQPYYFDQLAALYQRYGVLSGKITCEFMPVTDAIALAQPVGPIVVGMRTDENGSFSTTLSTMMEEAVSTTTLIGGGNGGNNKAVMSKTFDPKRDLGIGFDDDTLMAATNANPSSVWFASCMAANVGQSITGKVLLKVQLEFLVKFMRIVEVSGS